MAIAYRTTVRTTAFLNRSVSVLTQYFKSVPNLVSIIQIISHVQERFISEFVSHLTNAWVFL